MASRLFKKISFLIISILALVISIFLGIQYFRLGASSADFIVQKLDQNMLLSNLYYIILYLHISTGIVALSTGWLQFLTSLRKKHPSLHRIIGKIYTVSVLFSSLCGFFIALKATGGWISTAGFLLLSLFWSFTLIKGYQAIAVKHDYRSHQRWMIRNYALTFAAVTLRVYVPLSFIVFGDESFDVYYQIIAWLCWVPNLIVAEWIVRSIKH